MRRGRPVIYSFVAQKPLYWRRSSQHRRSGQRSGKFHRLQSSPVLTSLPTVGYLRPTPTRPLFPPFPAGHLSCCVRNIREWAQDDRRAVEFGAVRSRHTIPCLARRCRIDNDRRLWAESSDRPCSVGIPHCPP